MNRDKLRGEADLIWKLLEDLFPVHRSLTGEGYRRSLQMIAERLPIAVREYPTGTRVFDWTIPDEWNVDEVYVEDMRGKRIIDFNDCNYHVSPYSQPFSGVVTRDELLRHVYVHPDLPDAIPLVQLYYIKDWGLAMNRLQRDMLADQQYRVHIGARFSKGALVIGECVIKGQTDKEIVLSTYLCHPGGANDNLSGVATSVLVFRELLKWANPIHTYRLLIIPETIGSLTWLWYNKERWDKIVGGYVMTCNGTSHPITYKKSYGGNSSVDRAMCHVLQHSGLDHSVVPFFGSKAGGSDERQFNSPGIRLPFGSIMRAPYGEYPEYHTNKDDLSILSVDALLETAQLTLDTLDVMENDAAFRLSCDGGEPFLTKYNLLDAWTKDRVLAGRVIQELDGQMTMLQIAEKWGYPFPIVKQLIERFRSAGLCTKVTS